MRKPTLLLLISFRSPSFFQFYHSSGKARQHVHKQNQICGICYTPKLQHQKSSNAPIYHLYEPIEEAERLETYNVEAPITIGDQLHDRYWVVHKFGHGAYSTIWLAQDQQVNKSKSNPPEPNVLSELNIPQQTHTMSLGRPMAPSITDNFNIIGPKGTHACYITAPARVSLSESNDGSYSGLFY
ncbi:uncharacterized protein N7529_007538 [Penicillium soppii]|uniref:uncharacterized protein n=1 Tax=Penicillium soppii TaxID=69789 RepID=UPI0025491221|nr:uncharacterized protein N7529_007538 [Penicillium soppii]KAJ5860228.1 hypothetical protein N7529_007538 [Penicillium soppii]